MTYFVSGWLSAFCVMEIATGHLWLAAATGVTAAALPVIGRWWWMRDLENRYPKYASDDFYEWINRITGPRQ